MKNALKKQTEYIATRTPVLRLLTVFLAGSLLVGFFHIGQARADQIDEGGRNWIGQIRLAIQHDQMRLEALDLSTNVVPAKTRARLAEISDDQAQIWADTILEGDFYAEAAVTLDKIEAVLVEGIFSGYRVTYSSVAYDTSGCEMSQGNCSVGRIVESTYVSPELDNWTRDTDAYAEFVADET